MNVNDKISMEYESRAMLSETQYKKLLEDYKDSEFITNVTNTNEYFDTADLQLLSHSMVLRKRYVNKMIELTLKIKGQNGDTEVTTLIKNNSLPLSKLMNKSMILLLKNNNINVDTLILMGKLTTERVEINLSNHLLVIDKNIYNNKIDFNIEIEADSKEHADIFLLEYKNKYNLNCSTKYMSKTRRAILLK